MNKQIMYSLFFLLTTFLLFGCTHDLTIHQPLNGALFPQNSTINLEAEIRGGERGCGGEDCNCADWWWTSGVGTDLGLNKNNGTQVGFCRYTWTLPASTLGVGNHSLIFHSDQANYNEETEKVDIIVQP